VFINDSPIWDKDNKPLVLLVVRAAPDEPGSFHLFKTEFFAI